jgi:hypothetical protein
VGGIATDSGINPVLSGGGGGNGTGNPNTGGAGGGVVRINVGGTLLLQGKLSADGLAGPAVGSGGGAGGTINLLATTLFGAGLISANGGSGNGYGGGGGGGRILVGASTNNFTGTLTAFGGSGANWGGAGTIYTSSGSKAVALGGRLAVNNGGHFGAKTPIGNWDVLTLDLRDGAIAEPTNGFLTLSNLVIGVNGRMSSGKSNCVLAIVKDALIEPGGALTADANGFAAGQGPGAGLTMSSVGSGGGYGGVGGASALQPGGISYGSATSPTDPGSGGGFGVGFSGSGSQGGGAIRLTVAGTLTANGLLTAEGNSAVDENAGGGAGGSLWISAGRITGNGVIAAEGGSGELYLGGGGGGGRIAINAHSNEFAGTLSVLGGDGASAGQSGTIVVGTNMDVPAVLAQNPSGTVSNGLTSLDLTFNTALSPSTVSAADIQLSGPFGAVSGITVSVVTPLTMRVSFPMVTAPGLYNISVGPQIQDWFGQSMAAPYNGSFTLDVPVIQGFITDTNGQPVSGVVLQPDIGTPAITDTNGSYALGISPDSTITVTPLSGSLMFVPGSRTYVSLSGSVSNENYMAVTTIAPAISSGTQGTNLFIGWTGISGVTYDGFYSTDLTNWVSYVTGIPGTNGPMQLLVPVPFNDEPQVFFRLRATN